jgi:hypothetical protein
MAMALLDLPSEVLVEVLIAAAYARGLTRALRLKLVCVGSNERHAPFNQIPDR